MTGVAQGVEAMLPGQLCISGHEQTTDRQVTLCLLHSLMSMKHLLMQGPMYGSALLSCFSFVLALFVCSTNNCAQDDGLWSIHSSQPCALALQAGAQCGSTAELCSLPVLCVCLQCLGLCLVSNLQCVSHFCTCQVESSWARSDEGSA